jgi:hypothetical protein
MTQPAEHNPPSPDSSSPLSIVLAIFDFKFERYLTPWIIRATWVLSLCLFAFIACGVLYDWIGPAPGIPDKYKDMPAEFWEKYPMKRTAGTSFVWDSVYWIATKLGWVFVVMWVRMLLETGVVLFNIARTLTAIDNKTA